jgi:dephospho-CoA kinase
MPNTKIKTVIAFTGAFGSGCTTAAKHLRDERQFTLVKLSEPLRKIFKEKKVTEPSRAELQQLGASFAKKSTMGFWWRWR